MNYWCRECQLGMAGIANVLNIVLLIGVVSMCWCVPVHTKAPMCPIRTSGLSTYKGQKRGSDPPVAQNSSSRTRVTRTIQQTPDGTLTIEEIVYPDGTKTITKTEERHVHVN
jgi:hypothetical protein